MWFLLHFLNLFPQSLFAFNHRHLKTLKCSGPLYCDSSFQHCCENQIKVLKPAQAQVMLCCIYLEVRFCPLLIASFVRRILSPCTVKSTLQFCKNPLHSKFCVYLQKQRIQKVRCFGLDQVKISKNIGYLLLFYPIECRFNQYTNFYVCKSVPEEHSQIAVFN